TVGGAMDVNAIQSITRLMTFHTIGLLRIFLMFIGDGACAPDPSARASVRARNYTLDLDVCWGSRLCSPRAWPAAPVHRGRAPTVVAPPGRARAQLEYTCGASVPTNGRLRYFSA